MRDFINLDLQNGYDFTKRSFGAKNRTIAICGRFIVAKFLFINWLSFLL